MPNSAVSKIRDCAIRKSRNKSPAANACPCVDITEKGVDNVLHAVQSVLHEEIDDPASSSLSQICKKRRLLNEEPVSYIKPWEDTSLFQEDWLPKIN
jgi:hypothetical protein